MKVIDLRSDTVTKPTPAMWEAMSRAEVGDDVYREDPTINRLEELGAAMVGKEAALFVPSGTMGNQVAVMTHTRRGDEVIVDSESHIYYYEVAGPAVLSGFQLRPVKELQGPSGPQALAQAVRPPDFHMPRTSLVCLENTHNRGGGAVMDPTRMQALYETAKTHNLAVHLDGARVFNAAVALGTDVQALTKWCDTVMFCLSKGLSAPVGSLVGGSQEFIDRARKSRKILGGGMRQAGILAAAGIVALTTMVDRLREDHDNAGRLARGLAAIPGIKVDVDSIRTNIVLADFSAAGLSGDAFVAGLAQRGIKAGLFGPQLVRFTTHKDVDQPDIEAAIEVVREVVAR